jgi:hypothetical protein
MLLFPESCPKKDFRVTASLKPRPEVLGEDVANTWEGSGILFKIEATVATVTRRQLHGIGVPCSWALGCAVPGGRTPPLELQRARARVRRSRVACIGVCAVSARAGWGRGRVETCIAGFPPVGIGVRAAAARAECG